MMYIQRNDGSYFEWHVGGSHPFGADNYSAITDIAHVQADGDELEFVNTSFTNLRTRQNKRVVRFYGDDAKTIAGNLT